MNQNQESTQETARSVCRILFYKNSVYKNLISLKVCALIFVFFSSTVFAEVEETFVLCKRDKLVRTLRIEVKTDQNCKSTYTKQGIDQNIGAGQDLEACRAYLAGVRKKLEDAKWVCHDVKGAQETVIKSDEP